jgi:hypothetical protein
MDHIQKSVSSRGLKPPAGVFSHAAVYHWPPLPQELAACERQTRPPGSLFDSRSPTRAPATKADLREAFNAGLTWRCIDPYSGHPYPFLARAPTVNTWTKTRMLMRAWAMGNAITARRLFRAITKFYQPEFPSDHGLNF